MSGEIISVPNHRTMCLRCILSPTSFQFFENFQKQWWRKPYRGRGGGAWGWSRGWSEGRWGAVGDQWCCGIRIKCFLLYSNSHISCSSWSSCWIYLSFSWWCGIAKSECVYCSSYSISIQFGIIVVQWMNVLLTQYSKFQSWKEKSCEGGGAAEEREGVEGKVSYSVSGDLQIT